MFLLVVALHAPLREGAWPGSGRGGGASSVARWGSRGRWREAWWVSRVAESRWMEDSVREEVACSVSVSDWRESYSSLSLLGPPATPLPLTRPPPCPVLLLGAGRTGCGAGRGGARHTGIPNTTGKQVTGMLLKGKGKK